MVGLVIVSHGEFASGIYDAMRMICGEQDQVAFISLKDSESPEDMGEKIQNILPSIDSGDGVLFMADLFGASPFNTALRIYLASDKKIEIITGVNLPMLLEVVLNRGDNDLDAVFKCALNAGKEGIKVIPDSIRKNNSNKIREKKMTVSHVRMDNRLIHGQILVSWKSHIPINHLIVTNDKVANDPLQQTILKAVAPVDAKVSILSISDCVSYCNSPESQKDKIFIIAKLPEDGLALVKKGLDMKTLNLGNQAYVKGAKKLSNSVYLTQSGVQALKEIHDMGVRITCRMMPTDSDEEFWPTIEAAFSEWL